MSGSLAFYFGIAAVVIVFFSSFVDILVDRNSRWWRLLVRQGEISYSLYLLHNIALLAGYVLIIRFGLIGPSRFILLFGFCVPLAYALAALGCRFIEKPGIELGRRLSSTDAPGLVRT